jgi:hypothetical protein
MAQIQIEERRGLGWLWAIIAIVLVALAIWYFATRADTTAAPDTTAPATPTSIDVHAPPVPAAAA